MTCGRFPSAMACAIISIPPTSTAHFTPMPEPRASNCSAIWIASSRVGESTIAYSAWGFLNRPYMYNIAGMPVACWQALFLHRWQILSAGFLPLKLEEQMPLSSPSLSEPSL